MSTREEILQEILEVEKDLHAFKLARSDLYARVHELEGNPSRQSMLMDWPVMKVVDNGLIMAIVRCEGLLEDYRNALEKMDVPDNVLRLEKAHDVSGD